MKIVNFGLFFILGLCIIYNINGKQKKGRKTMCLFVFILIGESVKANMHKTLPHFWCNISLMGGVEMNRKQKRKNRKKMSIMDIVLIVFYLSSALSLIVGIFDTCFQKQEQTIEQTCIVIFVENN